MASARRLWPFAVQCEATLSHAGYLIPCWPYSSLAGPTSAMASARRLFSLAMLKMDAGGAFSSASRYASATSSTWHALTCSARSHWEVLGFGMWGSAASTANQAGTTRVGSTPKMHVQLARQVDMCACVEMCCSTATSPTDCVASLSSPCGRGCRSSSTRRLWRSPSAARPQSRAPRCRTHTAAAGSRSRARPGQQPAACPANQAERRGERSVTTC